MSEGGTEPRGSIGWRGYSHRPATGSGARRATVLSRGPSAARSLGLGNSACPSTTPACCALHHTISEAGLIGGRQVLLPAEVSLAHYGMLFLDERPEFR